MLTEGVGWREIGTEYALILSLEAIRGTSCLVAVSHDQCVGVLYRGSGFVAHFRRLNPLSLIIFLDSR